MLFRTLAIAALAAGAATTAHAQERPDRRVDPEVVDQTSKAPTAAPSATADAAKDASAVAEDLSIFRDEATPYVADAVSGPTAITDPAVVASPIVRDTEENRAKYRPLSAAGRRTAPIGN